MTENSPRRAAAPRGQAHYQPLKAIEPEHTSIVGAAVAQLRELILSHPAETFLGSEQDLVSHLKVSRSTFREAVQKLDSEQLLKVKRGVGGGYFSRRPSVDTVVYMASIYLHSKQPGGDDLFEASSAIVEKAAMLAACNPVESERARLEAMLSLNEPTFADADFFTLSEFFHTFALTIGEISGNAVIAMFLDIILKIYKANNAESILNEERAATLLDVHRELAHHIRKGDSEISAIVCRRINQLTRTWQADVNQ